VRVGHRWAYLNQNFRLK